MTTDRYRIDEQMRAEFRGHVLDVSRKIVSAYRLVGHSQSHKNDLSLPEQLAYLRARNTINIHRLGLAQEEERDLPPEVMDKLSKRALENHNWGRHVYWQAIAQIQRYGFDRIKLGEQISNEELVDLYSKYHGSLEKISEIEHEKNVKEVGSGFPGIRRVEGFSGLLNPLELFREIVARYSPYARENKFICNVVELAYRGAVDTLSLNACFDGMRNGVSFLEESKLCSLAKVAHAERGLAFWMPVHEADMFCLDRAEGMRSPKPELDELRERAEWSGEKIRKLEERHLGYGGNGFEPHEEVTLFEGDLGDLAHSVIKLKVPTNGIRSREDDRDFERAGIR